MYNSNEEEKINYDILSDKNKELLSLIRQHISKFDTKFENIETSIEKVYLKKYKEQVEVVNENIDKLYKKQHEEEQNWQRDEFIISLQTELAFFRDESVRLGKYSNNYKKEYEKYKELFESIKDDNGILRNKIDHLSENMFEINDEYKDLQSRYINSFSNININKQSLRVGSSNSMNSRIMKTDFSNEMYKNKGDDASLRDALIKSHTNQDISNLKDIQTKDYTKDLIDFERKIKSYDKTRKKKVENNVNRLKEKLKSALETNKQLSKQRLDTFYTDKHDIFDVSLRKVRMDVLKRKTMANYNSHNRINNSVINIQNDFEQLNNNKMSKTMDMSNEMLKRDVSSKKRLRPSTANIMKVDTNIKEIESKDKFQLETEVPWDNLLAKDKKNILLHVLQSEHVLVQLYQVLFPFNQIDNDQEKNEPKLQIKYTNDQDLDLSGFN